MQDLNYRMSLSGVAMKVEYLMRGQNYMVYLQ